MFTIFAPARRRESRNSLAAAVAWDSFATGAAHCGQWVFFGGVPMMIEQLETRQLFAVTLPMAKTVLPLTKANSHAKPPCITMPAAAMDHAISALTKALSHHAQGKK
jgi:hypothetical protein